ncbi:MAG: CsgG/HfaB family protein, partial [Synergistaceae bacterium]|nr:CsgG/HfaB family protein [Synergistaceae bacterium]
MKKKYSRLMAATLLALVLASARADAKPTLQVRAFDNKVDGNAEVPARAVTEMMTTELYDANIFSLVERENLDYLLEEQYMGDSGLMDQSTAPAIGKIKGARYTMTGAITVFYYNVSGGGIYIPNIAGGVAGAKTAYVTLNLRVIDTATSEIVYSASAQGEAKREAKGILT